MWIRLESSDPSAVKIYTGGVNAVSGEPWDEGEDTSQRRADVLAKGQSIQDYIVTPQQKWLDGTAGRAGRVIRFIAMPLGSKFTVEAQMSGEEIVGEIRFIVIAPVIEMPDPETIYVIVGTRPRVLIKPEGLTPSTTIEEVQTMIELRKGLRPDTHELLYNHGGGMGRVRGPDARFETFETLGVRRVSKAPEGSTKETKNTHDSADGDNDEALERVELDENELDFDNGTELAYATHRRMDQYLLEDRYYKYSIVLLNPDGSEMKFCPVSEMEKMLADMANVQF
ncbi:hypothetical protein MMC28_006738 [Mycoblastus sanguinarius]|nr:hypothetical protein [Mycoblastus sanguinarius]